MTRLFSYTIPYDDGAAPNPFHGLCSLAICKPAIRRVAVKGDWIAGLGSKNAPSGDLSGRLVYAMRVDEVVSMEDYDRRAPRDWPEKIPNSKSRDLADRLGDCIYDFSHGSPPVQREGVHGKESIDRDLGGKNVLLSEHFYYFGSRAIPLPANLQSICHQMQSHKSDANDPYVAPFLSWLKSLQLVQGQLYGWPDGIPEWGGTCGCAPRLTDPEGC